MKTAVEQLRESAASLLELADALERQEMPRTARKVRTEVEKLLNLADALEKEIKALKDEMRTWIRDIGSAH